MLDTIVLTLDRHEFEVLDPDRFSPSARGLLMPPFYRLGGRANFSCVLNPTKDDLSTGRYVPRLTLTKRIRRGGFAVQLRVEFSAPKLLFGNNFDELTARDFERVLDALHRSLARLGIRVSSDTLRGAGVSAIHYSKNMALTDHTSCSMVMGELNRIDLNRRLDLSRTDYRNEGHAIRYHASSFEVTFYDKLKDLKKARISEKRAIESEYGSQMHLFDNIDLLPRDFEILRMEVRLNTRAKIVKLVREIEPGTEPTFAALFNEGIAKGVLMHFWKAVQAQMPLIEGAGSRRPEDLLAGLAANAAAEIRPGALLQQLGCVLLVRSVGMRGASVAISRHCSPRTWQRYKRQLKSLAIDEPNGFSALDQVDAALSRFGPLRLADFHRRATGGSIASRSKQNPRTGRNGRKG